MNGTNLLEQLVMLMVVLEVELMKLLSNLDYGNLVFKIQVIKLLHLLQQERLPWLLLLLPLMVVMEP